MKTFNKILITLFASSSLLEAAVPFFKFEECTRLEEKSLAIHCSYGDAGELLHLSDISGGWISYTYDEQRRVASKETPDQILEYKYNALGRPLTIGEYTLSYDEKGNIRRIEGNDGCFEEFIYDDNNHLQVYFTQDGAVPIRDALVTHVAAPETNTGLLFVDHYVYHLLLDLYLNAPQADASFESSAQPCVNAWSALPTVRSPFTYGHSWISIDDITGKRHVYEAFPEGMKKNSEYVPSQAVTHAWKVTDEVCQAVIAEMEHCYNGAFKYRVSDNNCIHLLRKGLKIAHIPHPDFLSSMDIPIPVCVCTYINHLNAGLNHQEIANKYLKYPKQYTPVGTKRSLKKLVKAPLNY